MPMVTEGDVARAEAEASPTDPAEPTLEDAPEEHAASAALGDAAARGRRARPAAAAGARAVRPSSTTATRT